jgi:hypothetical protein
VGNACRGAFVGTLHPVGSLFVRLLAAGLWGCVERVARPVMHGCEAAVSAVLLLTGPILRRRGSWMSGVAGLFAWVAFAFRVPRLSGCLAGKLERAHGASGVWHRCSGSQYRGSQYRGSQYRGSQYRVERTGRNRPGNCTEAVLWAVMGCGVASLVHFSVFR